MEGGEIKELMPTRFTGKMYIARVREKRKEKERKMIKARNKNYVQHAPECKIKVKLRERERTFLPFRLHFALLMHVSNQ